jgi:small subunit ribosomal protein S7
MSRRAKDYSRPIQGDLIYNSVVLAKFINKIMVGGKKSTSQRIVYAALDKLSAAVNEAPLPAFEKALRNASPLMEVKSRRVGGATYQVPIEVKPGRSLALAMRWVITYARGRSGKPMEDRLAGELIDAYNKVGASMRKREETHKMADANKAFSHFRW